MTLRRFPCVPAFLGLLSIAAAGALAGEALTIADLAPKHAMFVVGVDDSKSMFEAFDRTGFRAIWDAPEFQAWVKKHGEETLRQFTTGIESLGMKMDDIKRPTGPMGLAAWFTGAEAEDGSDPPPAMLVLANYGAEAESMGETVVRALERAEEKKSIELAESSHDGVTIYHCRFPENKPEDKPLQVENDEIDAMAVLEEAGGGLVYPELHYARVDESLILCSEISQTEEAIDRLKGQRAPSIGDEGDFVDARRRLGETHAYAVLLGGPVRQWIKDSSSDLPEESFEQAMTAMFGVLGFDDLRAGAMGLRFDSDDAMMEQAYSVLAAKKTGLVALFDGPAAPFDPPPFVGADASGVTLFQFNFGGVIPLAMKCVEAMPPDLRAMVEPQVQASTMFIGPVLANLGPEVCVVSHLSRPLAADSQQQVWAIKMRDANALQQSLAGVMSMVGFESRDFQGNQIWSPAAGGMMAPDSVAIGLGFGWAFVGPTKGVEDLMRQAGAADNPKLADEKPFKAARRSTGDKGIAYGFWRIGPSLDWYEWYGRNIEAIAKAQAADMFGDEPPADDEERRWREDAIKGMTEGIPAWMKDPPPMDLIRRHLGDSVLEFRSTAEGFEGRSMMLRPDKD